MIVATETIGQTLAMNLFHLLCSEPNNTVFSPYSIQAALTRLLPGADGKTAEQICNVLGLNRDSAEVLLDQICDLEMGLVAEVENLEGNELRIANRLLTDKTHPLKSTFLHNFQMSNGEIDQVDFKHPQKIIAEVNNWVSRFTNGKIHDLLSNDSIDAETLMILINTIYLKLHWRNRFDPNHTKEKDFFPNGDDYAVTVKMMQQTTNFHYYAEDKFQLIQLPYAHPDLSMLIFLPDRQTPLRVWTQKQLSSSKLEQWRENMTSTEVNLQLPKFVIPGQNIELNHVLKTMGMIDAFNRRLANFSNMYQLREGDLGVYLARIIHQAMIEVDELGTEAAAATAITAQRFTSFHSKEPIYFIADHPFAFAITESKTGAILFMGQVYNPRQ